MASIQGIYLALFGRPADPAGLAYWNAQSKNGADLSKVIDTMTKLPEAVARFSGLTDAALVTGIYQALFDRAPDAAGLAFFTEQLKSGKQTIGSLAINILDGASGADLTLAQNREKAANVFTSSLDTPAEIAAYSGATAADFGRTFIKTVSADPNTIPTADKVQASINTGLPGASSGQTPAGGGAPADGGSTGGGGTTGPTGPTPETFTVVNAQGNITNVTADQKLFAGGGNPANGMQIATATGNQNHKIELALDARYSGNPTDVAPVAVKDGIATYSVNAGADVRFAYSAGITPNSGNAAFDLDLFDYKLKIDTDGGTGATFTELNLARGNGSNPKNQSDSPYVWSNGSVTISDDGGSASVTQNIQALQWYNGSKNIGAGDQYDVKLEAYLKGSTTKVAETAIKLVGNPTPTASTSLSAAATYKTNELFVGAGNSNQKFAVNKVGASGQTIELGLSGKISGGNSTDGTLGSDGLVHFAMASSDKVRFTYSLSSEKALSENVIKLKIDVDKSDATNFVELTLADRGNTPVGHEKNNGGNTDSAYIWKFNGNNAIVDDGGDGGKGGKVGGNKVTQNTQNISWYDGDGKNDLAAGKYDVILEAWSKDGVTLVGTNHVVFDISAAAQ